MPDHHHDHDDADLAALLDLDGEVLRSYWTDVLAAVRHAVTGARKRIVDLGAGTGVGTIGLAQRFDGAEVIAVDSSEEMLHRVCGKALALGLADRVRTVHADLDEAWPDLDPVDITWASMSLHHLADPDRVLAEVFAATRPGGLVAVAELTEPLRFLPDDIGFGRRGLESRCLAVLDDEHARSLPTLGSAWSPRLAAAGFTDVHERTIRIELDPPHSRAAVRYAQLWLRRLATGIGDHLDEDDRQALAVLVGDGPQSLQHGTELQLRGSRTLTLARRP